MSQAGQSSAQPDSLIVIIYGYHIEIAGCEGWAKLTLFLAGQVPDQIQAEIPHIVPLPAVTATQVKASR